VSDLLNKGSGLCINDTVLIRVEVTVTTTGDIIEQRKAADSARYASLGGMMKDLLCTDTTSHDIRFKFPESDEVLSAHKLILTARSPVFQLMFEAGMSESLTGVVLIEDIDPNTMKKLLLFIYTNSFGDCSYLTDADMTKALLVAARKYEIKDALLDCEYALSKQLTVQNLPSMLSFAESMSALELKKKCVEFGVSNCPSLFHRAQYTMSDPGVQESLRSSISKSITD
jgi:hypothetical protein